MEYHLTFLKQGVSLLLGFYLCYVVAEIKKKMVEKVFISAIREWNGIYQEMFPQIRIALVEH